jgi:hypothetical protein
MQISGQIKRYLFIFGVVIIATYSIYDLNTHKFSCDEWANSFKDKKGFNLVLTKKKNNYSRDAYFYGIDLSTKEPIEFYDGSGWIAQNFDKFNVGDTLIKNIGKYTITIKRKGKIIQVPFICDKTYADK